MQININDELAKKIQARVKASEEFNSIDKYTEFVLEEVIKQTSDQADSDTETESTYTKEQEAAVKQRLEDLGYLD